MKKIAVITLPLENFNYGGILQAYALQKYLGGIGEYKILLLDRRYDKTNLVRLKTYFFRKIRWRYVKTRSRYFEPIQNFIDSKITMSPPLYSTKSIVNYLDWTNVDVVITGSDQVWRKDYALSIRDDLFLSFENETKKISYAASFGANDYMLEGTYEAIKKLKAVSVRENSAQKYLLQSGLNVETHIDPTMLLPKEHYFNLASCSNKSFSGGVCVYMLDTDTRISSILEKLASKDNLEIYSIGKKLSITVQNYHQCDSVVDSVEDWLKAFRDAKYIVTDSFHGCVFAILFNKQFITLGNKSRGIDRFITLLDTFDLKERLLYNDSIEHFEEVLKREIDFVPVNNLLLKERANSERYLRENIE